MSDVLSTCLLAFKYLLIRDSSIVKTFQNHFAEVNFKLEENLYWGEMIKGGNNKIPSHLKIGVGVVSTLDR